MRKLTEYLPNWNRLNLARRIKRGRELDRASTSNEGKRWKTRRGITKYSSMLQIKIFDVIKDIIKKQGKCRILDIGCGQGYALTETKLRFGNLVETSGIRLSSREKKLGSEESHLQNFIDQLHIGSFENHLINKKFDLIISTLGFTYVSNIPLGLEKVCNLLSKNGQAHLIVSKSQINKKYLQKLEEQGFKIKMSSRQGKFSILKITNPNGRTANLESHIKAESKKYIHRRLKEK